MHLLGIAENVHDSCLTLASDTHVLCHVEYERVSRRKRARFEEGGVVAALAIGLLDEFAVRDDVTVVASRHTAERLWPLAELRGDRRVIDVRAVEHFEAHAGLALLSGGWDGRVLVMDGGGDRDIVSGTANASVFELRNGRLVKRTPLFEPGKGIDGRAWAVCAHALFGDVHAAGKLMGLAAFGNAQRFESLVRELLPAFLAWQYDDATLEVLASGLPRQADGAGADLAAALQAVFTEDVVAALRPHAAPDVGIVLSGGCALNVLTNSRIRADLPFARCDVPPCPGDEGQSLGAVLLAAAAEGRRLQTPGLPFMGAGSDSVLDDNAYHEIAVALAQDKVVASHVGRPEIGPRALGHRSLLARPTVVNRRRVSIEIKGRESFRPVAPVVREADAERWFVGASSSPYMSFSAEARAVTRDVAPGVVHVDGTARLQTASPESHVGRVLDELARIGEPPILINSSLNLAGMPITQTVADTVDVLRHSSIDAAVVGDTLIGMNTSAGRARAAL
jgi:carbamoyltransferase